MIKKRYIKSLDMELSPLGAGVMRFQTEDGAFSSETFRLMEKAMSAGINYFDTAYLYNSGHSEEFIRESLVRKYPRDSFCIADKLPVWLCGDRSDMERIFSIQLERLGVDYIDIYLLHSLHKATWTHVYEHGVLDFLTEKRREGRVRRIGFSYHDNADKLPMILDAYDWDMAQLQINYYDWRIHDVKFSYQQIEERGIPCVVMEPVGGGRLVKLPGSAEKVLKELDPAAPIASWGLRFCASLPNVAVVLSGMCSDRELHENIACFEGNKPLSPSEMKGLEKVVEILQEVGSIPCSACRYCNAGCPVGIDIPHIFQQYNDYKVFDRPISLSWAYMDMVPAERRADRCIRCGQCAKLCPQKIDIPSELAKAHEEALLLTLFKNDAKFDDKLSSITDNRLVLFGSGNFGRSALEYVRRMGLKRLNFCDNNENLWGTEINGVAVISPERLKQLYDDGDVRVLITNQYHYNSIKDQLRGMGIKSIN